MKIGRLKIIHPLYGSSKYTVKIVLSFLLWYRIESVEVTQLPNDRTLQKGQRAWVPKRAVRLLRPDIDVIKAQ